MNKGKRTAAHILAEQGRARRKLLKIMAGSGAVVASGQILPNTWTRPVVDTVVLPAHAQATGGFLTGFFGPATMPVILVF